MNTRLILLGLAFGLSNTLFAEPEVEEIFFDAQSDIVMGSEEKSAMLVAAETFLVDAQVEGAGITAEEFKGLLNRVDILEASTITEESLDKALDAKLKPLVKELRRQFKAISQNVGRHGDNVITINNNVNVPAVHDAIQSSFWNIKNLMWRAGCVIKDMAPGIVQACALYYLFNILSQQNADLQALQGQINYMQNHMPVNTVYVQQPTVDAPVAASSYASWDMIKMFGTVASAVALWSADYYRKNI